MESYATDRVPRNQRWPSLAILLVLTGNVTAMFFFSLGTQFSFLVGFPQALLPIAYMVVGATVLGALIMHISSREGLNMVLLSRGLGFGAKGSAVASLVYGVNYIFYFLFEGSIVSHALSQYFGIGIDSPTSTAVFAIVGAMALAFAWRGMHSMNILQRFGMPIFMILFIVGMVMLAQGHTLVGPGQWVATEPGDPTAMWQALSLANGQIVFQALMATDYGRFTHPGIGYKGTGRIVLAEMLMITVVMILGMLISYSMLPSLSGQGDPLLLATDPGFLFAAFMGLTGVLFTVITQIRINVMNLYSGSLAFSNTWDALSTKRVRRNWWMVGLLIIGIVLYPINILHHTATFQSVTGIMTNTWIFILLADYFICRKILRLAPSESIEYREGIVRDWNPTGLISMGVAILVGALGILGLYPVYYASFLAMAVGPILHVALTSATKGRYYFAPKADRTPQQEPVPALD
jgi:purine-cytosine permease-like protein